MKKISLIIAFLATLGFTSVSFADTNKLDAVGIWLNKDDNTGEVKARVQIEKRDDGLYYGRIIEIFDKEQASKDCTPCTDERKDKPVLGMEIIRAAKKVSDDWDWKGGNILDPENGKVYKLRMWTDKSGKQLSVRGYLGPFYRTQYWTRDTAKPAAPAVKEAAAPAKAATPAPAKAE